MSRSILKTSLNAMLLVAAVSSLSLTNTAHGAVRKTKTTASEKALSAQDVNDDRNLAGKIYKQEKASGECPLANSSSRYEVAKVEQTSAPASKGGASKGFKTIY